MLKRFYSISLLFLISTAITAAPDVVTTITPLHMLTKSIMQDIGEPILLIDNNSSPHSYRLKPSHVRKLQRADLIVWVGHNLESKLERVLSRNDLSSQLLTIGELPLPALLPNRATGVSSQHNHESNLDPHVWLDPDNAIYIVNAITQKLVQLDTANSTEYRSNAKSIVAEIKTTDRKLEAFFSSTGNQGFVTLHDSLQYFEKHYGLSSAGALSIDSHTGISAKRIAELKAEIRGQNIGCLLYESMPDETIISVLKEGTRIQAVSIDPLGLNLSKDQYSHSGLLLQLTNDIARCFNTD